MECIVEYLLNKTIKRYETTLNLDQFSYDKCKIVEFILYLLDGIVSKYPVKKVMELVYTHHHKYNSHPYTYDGKFSKSKMIVHLLNQRESYLLWLVKKLIDYEDTNE